MILPDRVPLPSCVICTSAFGGPVWSSIVCHVPIGLAFCAIAATALATSAPATIACFADLSAAARKPCVKCVIVFLLVKHRRDPRRAASCDCQTPWLENGSRQHT